MRIGFAIVLGFLSIWSLAPDPALAARPVPPPTAVAAPVAVPPTPPSPSQRSVVPIGFQDQMLINGLTAPTDFQFAPDGKLWIAEKSGVIKVFDTITSTTYTTFADLRANVNNYWDRGLMGFTLDPQFNNGRPYVYAAYTYDAPPGGTAPTWGTVSSEYDDCPTPPGPNDDGCVAQGRLVKLTANASNQMTGPEQVLIQDWCIQYVTHSMGTVAFGPDGSLYVSGGDGAAYTAVDYGQRRIHPGAVPNPCGDPPGGVGVALSPTTSQGGSLRAQGTGTSRNPISLDGTIIRIDPDTGLGKPGNPFYATSSDPNKQRVIAYGTRNPFRFTFRANSSQIWLGDVGNGAWEEINRIDTPGSGAAQNFGWPCYEGVGRNPGFEPLDNQVCNALYAAGTSVVPYKEMAHSQPITTGDTCPTGTSSITGISFYNGQSYPSAYHGALFFADYARGCIYAMKKGGGADPDPNNIELFAANAMGPVTIRSGPNGDLFYINIWDGELRRIAYNGVNTPPTVVVSANPTDGALPLTVDFSAASSSDPDSGDTLSYAWDLDADGQFDDSTSATPRYSYTTAGPRLVRVQVSDNRGGSTIGSLTITAGNTAPMPVIDGPLPAARWSVGDIVTLTGRATDAEQGTLPGSALTWRVRINHCPAAGSCHLHDFGTYTGATASFAAPDHEYPSNLEVRLTATDAGGLQRSTMMTLYPRTAQFNFLSNPVGATISFNGLAATVPFTREVIVGSLSSISASPSQTIGGSSQSFVAWSDGGPASHDITAGTNNANYTVTYSGARPIRLPIYGDGLAPGWENWSWNSTIDFAATTSVFSGTRDISFNSSGWGALSLLNPTPIDPSGYLWLEFSARAVTPGARLGVMLYDANNVAIQSALPVSNYGGDPDTNSWKSYRVPLVELGAATTPFKRIAIQEYLGWGTANFLIDEIAVVGYGVPPTPPPTLPPPPAPTPEPGVKLPIYGDTLATGWENYSWNGTLNLDGAGVTAYQGSAFASFSTAMPWAAASFYAPSPIATTSYNALSFAMRAATSGARVQVFVYDANNQPMPTGVLLSLAGGDPVVGSWTTYSIPLSALGLAPGQPIRRVAFQDYTGTYGNTFYLDDVALVGSAPPPSNAPRTTIYGDSRAAGWDDWSWNSQLNWSATPAQAGSRSVSLTAGAWGALSMHYADSAGFDTAPFGSLSFWMRASQPNQPFGVILYGTDEQPLSFVPIANYGGMPPADSWRQYTIPLADLNAVNRRIGRLSIQEISGSNAATVSFDEIAFVQGSSTPPPTPSSGTVVYGDALSAGWENWSWGGTANFANTGTVYSGTAATSYTYTDPWGGLAYHFAGFNTAGYGFVQFAARAAADGQPFGVVLFGTDEQPIQGAVPLTNYGGNPIAGAWRIYKIPLADLNAANRTITRIAIQAMGVTGTPTISVDDVQLLEESGSVQNRMRFANFTPKSTQHRATSYDVTAPTGSISIVNVSGQPGNAVILRVQAADDLSGVTNVRFSNRIDFEGAAWQPFTPIQPWLLSGGPVYVQFRDAAGNVSQRYLAGGPPSGPMTIHVPIGAAGPRPGW